MSTVAPVGAGMSRISAIEARLGIDGGKGVDRRPRIGAGSFENVLARVTTTVPSTEATTVPDLRTAPAVLDLQGIGSPAKPSMAGVPFSELFEAAGARHGVDPALLAAIADAESDFDPTAVSHAGAEGLMQLMPATAAGLGVVDSFDPEQAVDGAARLIAGHLRTYDGSIELSLAAYNAGGGAVNRFGGIPPYPETQAYVPKVLAIYQELRR